MIKLPIEKHDTNNNRLINYYNQIFEPLGVIVSVKIDEKFRHYTFIDSKTGLILDDADARVSKIKSVIFSFKNNQWVKAYPEEIKEVLRSNELPNIKSKE